MSIFKRTTGGISIGIPRVQFTNTRIFDWDKLLLTIMATIFCIGLTILFVLLVIFWGHSLITRTRPLTPSEIFSKECIYDGGTTTVSSNKWQCNNPSTTVGY